jgi:hypothetical protein
MNQNRMKYTLESSLGLSKKLAPSREENASFSSLTGRLLALLANITPLVSFIKLFVCTKDDQGKLAEIIP